MNACVLMCKTDVGNVGTLWRKQMNKKNLQNWQISLSTTRAVDRWRQPGQLQLLEFKEPVLSENVFLRPGSVFI